LELALARYQQRHTTRVAIVPKRQPTFYNAIALHLYLSKLVERPIERT
jgi:hypothetical protein